MEADMPVYQGVDVVTITMILLGIVFVAAPLVVFSVWLLKEYIKFIIYMRKDDGDEK